MSDLEVELFDKLLVKRVVYSQKKSKKGNENFHVVGESTNEKPTHHFYFLVFRSSIKFSQNHTIDEKR